ncbi:unnamed protein product, partial [Prunus brigantina]
HAGSSRSLWFVVNTIILSSPQLDHRPSMKFSRPESVGTNPALSVSRITGAEINILNDQNRTICSGQQHALQLRVTVNTIKPQFIHVKLEMISHGCNQAGFASARRAIQQVAPFPSLAHLLIKLPPPHEPVQVLDNLCLQVGLHGDCLERGWVLQIHS